MREKTQFVESKKKQIELQFVQMEKSYRLVFEENIKLKEEVCGVRGELEKIEGVGREKELRWNLEVAEYERKLYEMRSIGGGVGMSERQGMREQEIARLRDQLDKEYEQISIK